MHSRSFLILWIGMILVTYIPRVLPAFFMHRLKPTPKWNTFLNLIPYTAMSALIFPGILFCDESNPIIGLVGGIVAMALAWKKHSVIVVVLAAVLTCFCLYLFF